MAKRWVVLFSIGILIISACGGHKIKGNPSARERFKIARNMFEDEDYLDAKTQFRIITLSYQGSTLMDSAQYYLGECHFHLKEYILAAAEYQKLVKMFPHSQLIDDAQYKAAVCEYQLSPKYSLDQENTQKAIRGFQQFLEEYPTSEYREVATKRLDELRTKLARKEYEAGIIYYKMSYFDAAIVYFQSVIDKYYDTKYSPGAIFWKGQSLFKLNRLDEATELFEYFISKYDQHKLTSKARTMLREIARKKLDMLSNSQKVEPENVSSDSSKGVRE
ncbi:outer membrane protein assembly factor BamD [candidate division KSB1 bacterium]|nr:outer membrane protein assembly factor BamD [candidate division KSB1 bacterium]